MTLNLEILTPTLGVCACNHNIEQWNNFSALYRIDNILRHDSYICMNRGFEAVLKQLVGRPNAVSGISSCQPSTQAALKWQLLQNRMAV